MATAEDILKKAEARRKGKKFQPLKRRAWDYLSVDDKNETKNEQPTNLSNQEENRYKYRDENRNNVSTDIETNVGTNRYKYRDENRNKVSTKIETDLGTENRYKVTEQDTNVPEKFSVKKSIEHREPEDNKIIQILRKTTGYQKAVMQQITAHIKSLPDTINTIDIPIDTLSTRIKTTKDITRTSIKRLQKKSILLKEKGERGRLGSTQITVPSFILKECFNLFICLPKSLYEIGNENRYDNRNDDSVYSSSNIYTNTTTKNIELPEEWLKINIAPLNDIRFSLTQIKQLYTQELSTPEVIQESINHFAFGIKNNPKFKNYRDPLNVLMGVLRKGEVWIENNYESPQDIAQRQIIEQKKIERERKKQLEDDAFKLALDEWKESLSVKELEKITAKDNPGDVTPKPVKISMHFREIVWPNVKSDYLIDR
ncbi:MAG TPA: hypothetical protein VGH95_03500 [Candidatus Aquirickettsiella sp.]|jgi:hypothetical protein